MHVYAFDMHVSRFLNNKVLTFTYICSQWGTSLTNSMWIQNRVVVNVVNKRRRLWQLWNFLVRRQWVGRDRGGLWLLCIKADTQRWPAVGGGQVGEQRIGAEVRSCRGGLDRVPVSASEWLFGSDTRWWWWVFLLYQLSCFQRVRRQCCLSWSEDSKSKVVVKCVGDHVKHQWGLHLIGRPNAE